MRRVLVVCTGLIGDTLMCLPAICAARKLLPAAEIVGLVTQKTHPLLSMADCVDHYIVSDGAPLALRPRGRREAARLRTEIRAGRFDLAVIFLGDDYAPILAAAGIAHRVLVASPVYRHLATATYSIDARTWGPEEKLGAWRALGLDPGQPRVRLEPPASARVQLQQMIGYTEHPLLVLHPFGSTIDQWWPHDAAREFIRKAEEWFGFECLVVGSGSLISPRREADPHYRLVNRLTLEDLTALLAESTCVVTTDSGPFHLAGTLDRPGVGLFRASRPEHARRYPSITPILATEPEACRGRCTWDHCRESPCLQMSAIQPAAVLAAVEARIGSQQ